MPTYKLVAMIADGTAQEIRSEMFQVLLPKGRFSERIFTATIGMCFISRCTCSIFIKCVSLILSPIFHSGKPCPSGECDGGDLCYFVPDGQPELNSAPTSDNAAGSLVNAVLDGSFPTNDVTTTTAPEEDDANVKVQIDLNIVPQPNPSPTPPVAASPSSGQGQVTVQVTSQTIAQPSENAPTPAVDPIAANKSPSIAVSVPQPYTIACNLCRPGQRGINGDVKFNGELMKCASAYDLIAKMFKEGDNNCVGVQAAFGSTCCEGEIIPQASVQSQPTVVVVNAQPAPNPAPSPSVEANDPTKVVIPVSIPIGSKPTWQQYSSSGSSPTGDTTVNISLELSPGGDNGDAPLALSGVSSAGLEFPSDTYFCGSSRESAAMSCSNACPNGQDSECPGDTKCFGNTECANKESFFCGKSWLDASDKCSKACPSGDALECDSGEAWYVPLFSPTH